MSTCNHLECTAIDNCTELIKCEGICGKSFHPICAGIRRGIVPDLKKFLECFRYVCDECREISLSHVMLAIKYNNQCISSLSDTVVSLRRELESHKRNSDVFVNSLDDINSYIGDLKTDNKKKFSNIQTALDKMNSTQSIHTANVENVSTQICELKSTVESVALAVDKLKIPIAQGELIHEDGVGLKLNLISSKITEGFRLNQSYISKTSSDSAEYFDDLICRQRTLDNELLATKRTVVDLSEEINIVSTKLDTVLATKICMHDVDKPTDRSVFDELSAHVNKLTDQRDEQPSSDLEPAILRQAAPKKKTSTVKKKQKQEY